MKQVQDTDLVDDDEDCVEEHQVVFLQRQVVSLLQREQHCSHQGDLSGTEINRVSDRMF